MDSLIIFGAKYLFVAVPLLYLLAWLQASKRYKLELIAAIIIAGIIAVILDKIGGHLYYDPRPFVTHHVKPLVSHAADNGFPSEHTVFTITVSTLLLFYRPKLGTLSFLIGVLVGVSRVAAHIHSPIDIIGGILMGVAAGIAGYYLIGLTNWFKPAEKPHRRGRRLDSMPAAGEQVPHQRNQSDD